MKRYLYLIIGTISMVIYGLMYNWTVFSLAVQTDLAASTATIANVFSLCQVFITLGGMVSGFLYYKINYRLSMIITSFMMGIGLFMTSRVTSPWMIYLFYSFGYTFAAGFAYKSLLTTIVRWFDDKPGLASGILLMGAGLTAFVFNVPMSLLIEKIGWRSAMAVLSLLSLLITMICALIVKQAEIQEDTEVKEVNDENQISTRQMLLTKKFWFYFIWSVLLLAGCTALSGNAVNCGISFGITATTAASLSMIISLFNSTSRVFYGMLYDKKGRKVTMGFATCFYVFSITLLFIAFLTNSSFLLSCSFIFIGLTFGAVPTVSNAYILKIFGSKYYPSNFAIQQLYSLFASVAGTMMFSIFFTKTQTYSSSYTFLIIYAAIAVVLYFALNRLFRKDETHE